MVFESQIGQGQALPSSGGADHPICGFWRRILALILDTIFLGVFGVVLGLLFGNQFAEMGPWGRVVGFVIALAYFGVLNSVVGSGQSFGKKIAKIRIVDADGQCVSLGTSFMRSVALEAPFFLNGLLIPPSVVLSPIGTIIGLLIFVLGGSIIYLYIFNRRTRQSAHDLIAGTYVVRADVSGALNVQTVAKLHYGVIGTFAVLALVFSSFVAPKLMKVGPFPDILAVQQKLQDSGKLYVAGLTVGKAFGTGGSHSYIATNVVWKGEPASYEQAINEVAALILSSYPNVDQIDRVAVTVAHGYDIGIASAWQRHSDNRSPSEWKTKLQAK